MARHALVPTLRIADGEDEFAARHQGVKVLVHERPRVVFHRVELLQLAQHPGRVSVEVRPKHLVVVVPHAVPQDAQGVSERGGAGFLEADAHDFGREVGRSRGQIHGPKSNKAPRRVPCVHSECEVCHLALK